MSEKRKRDASNSTVDDRKDHKKQRSGFKVGPDNLPDGTYKRKTQGIKKSLIQKAQIKKNYAKLKRQGKVPDEPERLPKPATVEAEDDTNESPVKPHPDRQTLIDIADRPNDTDEPAVSKPGWRKRKPKSAPFKREYEQAEQRKVEAEERRKAREEAERQRQSKLEERERFRKAMAKARTGGPNGQRKLGRESNVLLEKVKKMVGEGG